MNGTRLIIREEKLYLSSWIMLAQEQIGVNCLQMKLSRKQAIYPLDNGYPGTRLYVFLQQK